MRELKTERRRGFTLLEVMVAAVILIIALVGSLALVVGMLRGNQNMRARDTAYFIAQEVLDQYASTSLSVFPGLTSAAPALPTCYSQGEDSFVDRPIPCVLGATAAAYWVRTWSCCETPTLGGGLFNSPNPPPLVAPTPCTGIGWVLNQTIAGTIPATSATCPVAVEVTWPTELGLTSTALFTDVGGGLSFQNHVFLTMVRSQ